MHTGGTTINLSVRTGTAEKLDTFCGTGRIKRDVIGRLIEFFVVQPAFVQRVILGEIDGPMIPAYAAALRNLAGTLECGAESATSRSDTPNSIVDSVARNHS
ncbi:MAG TPA: hypothetical protein VK986_15935 [Tepidisphaeraceae bacterium]|nr:hypothetical protein [Tepidisphaeraceae bacterium]